MAETASCSARTGSGFTEAELGGVIAAFSARQASEILIGRARERARGAGDNISLAIIKLVEVPTKEPEPPGDS
jgi:hypothetical protein